MPGQNIAISVLVAKYTLTGLVILDIKYVYIQSILKKLFSLEKFNHRQPPEVYIATKSL